jgi:hypothetical protein
MKQHSRGASHLKLVVAAAALLAAGGVVLALPRQPANATVPSAIEMADKALSGPGFVEDEGAYNMIDAIGPSGITQSQATDEVTSRTMIGGLPAPLGGNGDNPYGGGQ